MGAPPRARPRENPDDADELAQETWEAALSRPPREAGPLRPWLSGVARNLARMRARSSGRRARREESAEVPEPAPSPDELLERIEMQQQVVRRVLALDEPFRSTLLLRYYEGCSAAEIARRQGVPAGTVRWRLKHGLDDLRRQLDDAHQGDRKRWAVLLAAPPSQPARRLRRCGTSPPPSLPSTSAVSRFPARTIPPVPCALKVRSSTRTRSRSAAR